MLLTDYDPGEGYRLLTPEDTLQPGDEWITPEDPTDLGWEPFPLLNRKGQPSKAFGRQLKTLSPNTAYAVAYRRKE